ncbi:GNAT family N-acetyltransferase [Cryptosporangium arvum]|uniref:GNAT family N-acetyltransferase n=1 Tax=Cryptosporangium arvum TaxID=80871 RepID=UPI000A06FFD8|nr:GNAT family N-acetyltransferase [Cryptosporangium arvum]
MKTPLGSLWVTVAARAELPAVFALRHEVFVVGQGVPVDIERDELDETAVHVGAYEADPAAPAGAQPRLVGTGRLVGEPPGPGRVGRMAVRADARRAGVGTAVLRGLERAAMRRGNPEIVLHAQLHAAAFYEKAGYTTAGPEFEEAGIRHVEMRKDLPLVRPVTDADSAGLIELIGTTWGEYPGCVLDIDGEEPWLRAPGSYYAANGGRMWVAELRGAIVGSIALRPGPDDTAELKSLYVGAAARRHGLGEVLTSLVEDDALARGVRQLELWTDTRFADAHRFYARLGYTRLPGHRELHDLSDTVEYPFVKTFPYTADLAG